MKVIDASVSLTLRVVFTVEEAAALQHGAETHYDAECRALPALKLIKTSAGDDIGVALTWRDLDILSKICESPLVNDATSKAVWLIFAKLRSLRKAAQENMKFAWPMGD